MTGDDRTTEAAGSEPASAWDAELRELAARRALVLEQGGEEGVARQHSADQFTVVHGLRRVRVTRSIGPLTQGTGKGLRVPGGAGARNPGRASGISRVRSRINGIDRATGKVGRPWYSSRARTRRQSMW